MDTPSSSFGNDYITIISRINWAHEPGQEKRIDLWWGGLQNNGDLMLLLAHLLRLNPEWSDSRLTVRSIARSEGKAKRVFEQVDDAEEAARRLQC